MTVRCTVVLADGALLSTGARVCARELVVVVVRCILYRSVVSLRFSFFFSFFVCHRCRVLTLSFVRRDCIGESLMSTQNLI